ncbi:MAG TPA: FliM/FliN family flagellar motor switch protein [Candidatus Hydrogenedentes bacterium]|nr:FliM/FliN family flagellar motor switch protein [Candidatus Hydrogenedentota bacterium]HNT88741.1 FliM/FliN family flagellar motor switch protein [Candidatus Hydrogenedentota bacterium]
MTQAHPDPDAAAPGPPYDKELSAVPGSPEHLDITNLSRIRLTVTADLGTCNLLVRDVIELRRGSVLQLDKVAGETLDISVNGIRFAKGEVLVLGDALHVRISEVINPRGSYEP